MNHPRKRIKTPRAPKAPLKSDVGAPVPLPKPNTSDPLSEPSRHRRVWAAYLARGLTRRQFAEALGTNYHTVNRWDAGAAVMSLEMLEKASELLSFSMDELCFGRRGRPAPVSAVIAVGTNQPGSAQLSALAKAVLSEAEIRALFDIQHIDPLTRAAFGEHAASPAGRYQSFTAAYVEAWCIAYAKTSEQEALAAGVNARATAEAVAAGVSPITADVLRNAFGRAKQ